MSLTKGKESMVIYLFIYFFSTTKECNLKTLAQFFQVAIHPILVNESQRHALSGQGFAVEQGFGFDSNVF